MTARAAGINPGDYLRDVLLRISTCNDATMLTPHGWKQHFQADVRISVIVNAQIAPS